ncbi:hypothetical protein SAMN05421820_101560 [Pedobacter steynii]|uniref:Uncharacterized protein n=1 Tax=Pedobacter steynii TaxID=430522 RepID=A0A1G9KF30_9SPHI|nr:hypothetical protein SAMN05421820_101560 [Pedobacter steynii]
MKVYPYVGFEKNNCYEKTACIFTGVVARNDNSTAAFYMYLSKYNKFHPVEERFSRFFCINGPQHQAGYQESCTHLVGVF